jgi:hypothetical protein
VLAAFSSICKQSISCSGYGFRLSWATKQFRNFLLFTLTCLKFGFLSQSTHTPGIPPQLVFIMVCSRFFLVRNLDPHQLDRLCPRIWSSFQRVGDYAVGELTLWRVLARTTLIIQAERSQLTDHCVLSWTTLCQRAMQIPAGEEDLRPLRGTEARKPRTMNI